MPLSNLSQVGKSTLKIIFLELRRLLWSPPGALFLLALPPDGKHLASRQPLPPLPPAHWLLSPQGAGSCPTSLLKILPPQLLMSWELLNSIDTSQSLPYLTSRQHITLSFVLSPREKKKSALFFASRFSCTSCFSAHTSGGASHSLMSFISSAHS